VTKIITKIYYRKINIIRASFITTLYAGLTILLQPISFGPVQVRIADALSILPYFPQYGINAVIGLTLGTLIANIVSPYGFYDVLIGSATNLIYSIIALYIGRIMYPSKKGLILVASEEIIVTTFFIGYVLLHIIYNTPVEVSMPGVAFGSIISQGLLGISLGIMILRREGLRK